MSKHKVRLDRKTSRAIKNALKAQRLTETEFNDQPKKASSYWSLSAGSNGVASIQGTLTASNGRTTRSAPTALPLLEGSLFVSRYCIDETRFHNRVARQALGRLNSTYVRQQAEEENTYSREQVVFFTAEDRDLYETWMDAYLEKFSGQTDLNLPPPLDGYYPFTLRASFSPRVDPNSVSSVDDYDAASLKQWLWALDNCEGEVRFAGAFWFFELEDDATLFKLTFS